MNPEKSTDPNRSMVREDRETSELDSLPPEVAPAFERMERLLRQIRGALDTAAREAKYRDFSPLRLAGAVLEVFVAGLVVMALLDWIFAAPAGSLLIKLAFAIVLQLSALTAFVVSRQKR